MRVLMTGGGTAGHINPALAIAHRIRQEWPDTEFLFVGSEGRMETRLVPAAGYPLKTIKMQGFRRGFSPKALCDNVVTMCRVMAAEKTCERIIREFRPDIAIGTGGYVCGPVLKQAAKAGVPVVLHESNALPGVTVKLLAKKAAAVLIATEAARKYLPQEANCIVTGNPLREDFLTLNKAEARARLGLRERPFILSFGGSLGAQRINETMAQVLKNGKQDGRATYVHGAGKAGFETMRQRLSEAGVSLSEPDISVRDYIDDMPTYMAAADLVICRCGAMTISELPVAGKPAILIPLPTAAENHQFHNAMSLVERNAAVCIEEKDLSAERLWGEIKAFLDSPERLAEMGRNAEKAAVPDASERILAEIKKIVLR